PCYTPRAIAHHRVVSIPLPLPPRRFAHSTRANPTLSDAIPPNVRRALLVLKLAPKVGEVIATVGGVASIALPVMIREMVPPLAAKSTFAVAVADVVGVKRTVTSWLTPTPTRVNALPHTT